MPTSKWEEDTKKRCVHDGRIVQGGRLPDYHALFGGTVHRIAFLDIESLEEWLEIAQGCVHTPASQ